jgi:hypothetical protein
MEINFGEFVWNLGTILTDSDIKREQIKAIPITDRAGL